MHYQVTRKYFWAYLGIILALLMAVVSSAQGEEKLIAGLGVMDEIILTSKDLNIGDVQHHDLKPVIGKSDSSEIFIENMMLVMGGVYTETQEYGSDNEKTLDTSSEEFSQVYGLAQVRKIKVSADSQSNVQSLNNKPYPRIMVVLYSIEGGTFWYGYIREGNRSIENNIESSLLRKGFEIVDAKQVSRQKQIEIALSTNDFSTAVVAAKGFGAEVLITGNIRRMFVNSRRLYGRDVRFYSNEIQMKAMETGSAKVLYSGARNRSPSAINHIEPLEDASSELIDEMIAGILDKWGKDGSQVTRYELNVSNARFKDISAMKSELENLAGLASVQTSSFRLNVARLEVSYKGSLEDLVDKISQIKSPALEIISFQSNTIDVMIGK